MYLNLRLKVYWPVLNSTLNLVDCQLVEHTRYFGHLASHYCRLQRFLSFIFLLSQVFDLGDCVQNVVGIIVVADHIEVFLVHRVSHLQRLLH